MPLLFALAAAAAPATPSSPAAPAPGSADAAPAAVPEEASPSRPVPNAAASGEAEEIASHEKIREELSDYYTIDKKYRSMTGPQSTMPVAMEPGPPELLWITGYSADVVGDAGDPTGLDQFMCHSNLDLDSSEYIKRFHLQHDVNPRLFTLSQGQMDIEFPAGFGIPVWSDEKMALTTQVLNLNYDDCDMKVRHRTRIRYVRDADLSFAMQPLYEDAVFGLKLLAGTDGRYGMDPQHADHGGASCLPGQNAATFQYHDDFGRTFTGHWIVHPGRETNRTPVDAMLALKRDTTIHFIAVHLHPFAESLELVDATEGKTVFKSFARNPSDRIGLDRVDTFESAEGIPILHGHHYELISTYDNTSGQDQDSMAVMYLYLRDPDFQRPAAAPAVASR
ncbi:MAG TPA: hypothetical protein VFL12_10395 [Thermoanaerobaculia bacterium]|nr:hypothetical protein [Thermoanaerobaculia bacterium]